MKIELTRALGGLLVFAAAGALATGPAMWSPAVAAPNGQANVQYGQKS